MTDQQEAQAELVQVVEDMHSAGGGYDSDAIVAAVLGDVPRLMFALGAVERRGYEGWNRVDGVPRVCDFWWWEVQP